MDWTQLPKGLLLAAVVALPASGQEIPVVAGPPPIGVAALPGGNTNIVRQPPPPRPGLFGWRQRRAERKKHLQDAFIGYPEEFNEWPLGRPLYDLSRTEVANGQAARLILNDMDFIDKTADLNYRGQDKLAAITAQLPTSFSPVIVERTPWDPQVAELRRLAILGKLANSPFPIPAERVVIAPPVSRGLTGVEAVIANTSRTSQFSNGGSNVAGNGFTGGTSPGGSGAGSASSSSGLGP
jgi:hypothetical protein